MLQQAFPPICKQRRYHNFVHFQIGLRLSRNAASPSLGSSPFSRSPTLFLLSQLSLPQHSLSPSPISSPLWWSQLITVSNPPPSASPFTAAMTGFLPRHLESGIAPGAPPGGHCPGRAPGLRAFSVYSDKLALVEKLSLALVRTATDREGSSSIHWNTRVNSMKFGNRWRSSSQGRDMVTRTTLGGKVGQFDLWMSLVVRRGTSFWTCLGLCSARSCRVSGVSASFLQA